MGEEFRERMRDKGDFPGEATDIDLRLSIGPTNERSTPIGDCSIIPRVIGNSLKNRQFERKIEVERSVFSIEFRDDLD